MSQRERIFAVLESKGWISNEDFDRMGLTHIGRNRITDEDARVYFGAKGKLVRFSKGRTFLENKWELIDIKNEAEDTSTMRVACLKCGNVFEARVRDIKRGFGRACSRKCAGALKGQPRANVDSLAAPEIAAQGSLL